VAEADADRMALGLELGAALADVLPGVRHHADLVPQVLAVKPRQADVVVREGGPGVAVGIVGDLAADRQHLAVFALHLGDQRAKIEHLLPVEVRAAGAVEAEQIMARLSRGLGRRPRRQLQGRDVIDGDRDAVFLAPLPGEGCDPSIVGWDEVAPLDDLQRLVRGPGASDERGRDRRRQPGERQALAGVRQKAAPRDATRVISCLHFLHSPSRRQSMRDPKSPDAALSG
jgi:hypothetical protein